MKKPTSNTSECIICGSIIHNKYYYKRKTCSKKCFIKNNKGGIILKGKSYEEIYGKERAEQKKNIIREQNMARKGKSYEEIYGKKRAQKIKRKISKKHKGVATPKEVKDKISNAKKGWKSPLKGKTWEEIHGKERAEQMRLNFIKLMKGKYFKPKTKFIYNGKYFRSNWEIAFVKFCEKNNLRYYYEPKKFVFDTISYIPDFYLPDWNMWVEVKGYWDKKSLLKCSLFEETISSRLWKIDDTNCQFMLPNYNERNVDITFDDYINEEWVSLNGC